MATEKMQKAIQDYINGLCCGTNSKKNTMCYVKNINNETFSVQSTFPNKTAINGSSSLQETVYNNVYVTGAETDGQYSLRNGSNDVNGSNSSYAIAFNFSIDSNFSPYKIYSQKLLGNAGGLYKAGFWAKERASGNKARFTFVVKDGSNVIATGNTGDMTNTYTNYKSSVFTMPSNGFVNIEIYTDVNGSANGNDPLLDSIGLAEVSITQIFYKKETVNNITTYYNQLGDEITGTALTELESDIANAVAVETPCTF